ncbi:polysaccharide biosynthesis tyrosine autokinase [Pseudonocardia sp. Ae717_Ps2]|uniref:polysaccharide biosynthesis tyrosine autokinase n=1 Tax=Pseudonocardia sp. Ae717_Ps2 TaxID=1885573 RepID=UPI00094A9F83|nr:polysaccharide biosynthesis tyrosine autokinase [Pseudonocardia sp. Ae717_Ps2]
MSVRDLWILLRDSRVLVIAGMAIGLAGSLFAYAWLPTAYTASTSMYVVATGPTPQSAFLGAQLSTERMATYADLLTSPRVADAVIDKLRLPDTPDELIDTFDARNKNKSTAIQLDVTATDPGEAAAIANAAADTFVDLVAQLEKPAAGAAGTPITVRIVGTATPPPTPSSPGLLLLALPGVVLGLLAGVVAVLMRESVVRPIRRGDDLERLVGSPTLAVVPRDPGTPRRSLAVLDRPWSPAAEAHRSLAAVVVARLVPGPAATVVAFSGARARAGTSTTVANLALALGVAGNRVLVIDADLRQPAQHRLFQVPEGVGWAGGPTGEATTGETIVRSPRGPVDVLASPAPSTGPATMTTPAVVHHLLDAVRDRYDHVLVDLPPVLAAADAAVIGSACDGVVLVAAHGRSTADDVRSAADRLGLLSARLLGSVLTKGRRSEWPAHQGPATPSPPSAGASVAAPEEDRPLTAEPEPEPTSAPEGPRTR